MGAGGMIAFASNHHIANYNKNVEIPLNQLADSNAIILTPGGVARQVLLQQWAQESVASALRARQSPPVFTVDSWLKTLWNQVPLNSTYRRPALLSPSQELAIWQSIIAASEWSDVLMQVHALARSARGAHRLMTEWRIADSELKGFTDNETLAFRSWTRELSRRCQKENWAEEYRLADLLMALPEGLLSWPAEILTYGLQQTSVQLQELFAFLTTRGCTVRAFESGKKINRCVRAGFSEQIQEFDHAATWARKRLREDEASSVAIALADLPRDAQEIRAALDRVFYPRQAYPSLADNRDYHLAHGTALTAEPIVDTALRVLSQSRHRVDLGDFSLLLRSKYIAGGMDEFAERSRLDAHLRSLGELQPSLVYVAAQIRDRESQLLQFECPQLLICIHRWREQINALPRLQSASAWAQSFSELLSAMGWPGEFERAQADHNIMSRWDDLLSQLCSLDAMSLPMPMDEALRWLRNLARDVRVSEPVGLARLHIISVEDAASLVFDHLWVCGLNDEQWPPPARPHPLLPVAIQQQYSIPPGSSYAVGEMARCTTRALMQNSENVVFSFSRMQDEREFRMSPLIAAVGEIEPDGLPDPQADIDAVLFASRKPESVPDHTQPLSPSRASGGTAILKDQAACPFRAFVTHRLRSDIPEEPEAGLDASERGTLLHKVLEGVWLKLLSHAALVDASEAERERIVTAAAQSALESMVWKKQETLTPKFLELELERLVTLVMAWLHREQQRSPFTVLRPEAQREIDLSGLTLKMRIDRIDQNDIGERIIIDYKTGNTTPASWFGERPDEPQLPLYALSEIESGHSVAALSFAEVRTGNSGFKGISNVADVLPGVKAMDKHVQGKHFEDWASLLQDWRSTLNRLAADFVAGEASVDPKSAKSCRYCELEGVCRINELDQRLGRVDIAEDEDD